MLQLTPRHTPLRTSGEQGRAPDDDEAGTANRAAIIPDSKTHVLVVDDDVGVRETLAELLDDSGFCSIQASDAAEALTILRQATAVDILVTDLSMPGDDGIALIRQARAIRNGLPAVLLTGNAEHVASVTTMAGGNFHVLRKPVESGRLIQQLELLVAKPYA